MIGDGGIGGGEPVGGLEDREARTAPRDGHRAAGGRLDDISGPTRGAGSLGGQNVGGYGGNGRGLGSLRHSGRARRDIAGNGVGMHMVILPKMYILNQLNT